MPGKMPNAARTRKTNHAYIVNRFGPIYDYSFFVESATDTLEWAIALERRVGLGRLRENVAAKDQKGGWFKRVDPSEELAVVVLEFAGKSTTQVKTALVLQEKRGRRHHLVVI